MTQRISQQFKAVRPVQNQAPKATAATPAQSTGASHVTRDGLAATRPDYATALGAIKQANALPFPVISQLKPDGVNPSSKYTNAQSNCAPTCLTMVAQHFGVMPTGQPPNESQILAFKQALGTGANGSDAGKIPAALAAVDLKCDQWNLRSSSYYLPTFSKLPRADQDKLLQDGLTMMQRDGIKTLNNVDISKIDFSTMSRSQLIAKLNVTPDQMRVAIQKQETVDKIKAQVDQGRPVVMNVQFNGLPAHHGGPGTGHYILVTGAQVGPDGKLQFTVNDPYPPSGQTSATSYAIAADVLANASTMTDYNAVITGVYP